MLGGGSSLNGQVYIRGSRKDFDDWAAMGATGWTFDEVLPYFARSETWAGAPSQGRGSSGPLSVAAMRSPHPLCDVFVEGCGDLGIPHLEEYNVGNIDGAYPVVASQRDGWRCSTEKAYLRPARSRPNLTILTGADVERVSFLGDRARGVIFTHRGQRCLASAENEIVISAGAIGSPALLMRSGLGPAETLKAAGIEVICEMDGVGANLSEHVCVVQNKFVNRPTLNSQTDPLSMLGHMLRFAWNRSGALAAPAVQAIALARSESALAEPDIQLYFMPLAYDMEPNQRSVSSGMPKRPAVSINASVCKPKGRGRVSLNSDRSIRISQELLGHPDDLAAMVKGVKIVDRLFKTPAFSRLVIGDRIPTSVPQTDGDWADYVRMKAIPAYHPNGTCRMGSDPDAVVDPRLRVNGIRGLRVADASIMHIIPSTNTNAPTIMIGEKAAEMILEDNRACI